MSLFEVHSDVNFFREVKARTRCPLCRIPHTNVFRHLQQGHEKSAAEAEALLPASYRRRTKSEREADDAADAAAEAEEAAVDQANDSDEGDEAQAPDDVETSDDDQAIDDAPVQQPATPPRRLSGRYEPVFPQNRPEARAQAPEAAGINPGVQQAAAAAAQRPIRPAILAIRPAAQ